MPLVTAIGDAMAGVINKVWSYFVCFGTKSKKADDLDEKAILAALRANISDQRTAHTSNGGDSAFHDQKAREIALILVTERV